MLQLENSSINDRGLTDSISNWYANPNLKPNRDL